MHGNLRIRDYELEEGDVIDVYPDFSTFSRLPSLMSGRIHGG